MTIQINQNSWHYRIIKSASFENDPKPGSGVSYILTFFVSIVILGYAAVYVYAAERERQVDALAYLIMNRGVE